MGLFDRIFNRNEGNNTVSQVDDSFERHNLAVKIVNLVDKISRTNSFDSSIWNLRSKSTRDFENQSLEELQQLHDSLSRRLDELQKQSQRTSSSRQAVEDAKWTGNKLPYQSDYDFDRSQRDD